ncbi:MAG: hypothetical protein ACLUMQ_02880 [Streptococcus salivarius]
MPTTDGYLFVEKLTQSLKPLNLPAKRLLQVSHKSTRTIRPGLAKPLSWTMTNG